MTSLRFRSRVAIASLVVLVSTGALGAAQSMIPQKIKVLTLVGRPLTVVAGEAHGTFAKYGVAVETENLPNSDTLRAELAAGKGDLAYLAVDNAVAMDEQNGADVIVVMGGEGSQNELIVQPENASIKDLRGRVLLVDAVHTAYALQLKKILLLHGLQAGVDYEMRPFGATPLRLTALREHKEFAGSMLGPPTSFIGKRAGLVSLGSVQDFIGPYQASGYVGQRKWAQEHREALTNFLAACIEEQRWLMVPAHRQQVIDMMIKESKLTPDVAAETYDSLMTRPGGYEKDSRLDLAGFENVLKLRAEMENEWAGHPPSPRKYYDPSYYTKALAKAKQDRWE